ncbi:MAG: hypothetical protein WBN44_14090, partial [Woeseiaceae bacterium]
RRTVAAADELIGQRKETVMKLKYMSMALIPMLVAACGDGSGVNQRTGNVAPTISAIGAQAITANDTSSAIGFTVSDEQPDMLNFSVMSDNPTVIADEGLELAGGGADRTITLTPIIDTVGDTFITIVATDPGGLSAGTSFLVTVDPEQKSMQQITRQWFDGTPDGEPELVNAVEFAQDADSDDFADLLTR